MDNSSLGLELNVLPVSLTCLQTESTADTYTAHGNAKALYVCAVISWPTLVDT